MNQCSDPSGRIYDSTRNDFALSKAPADATRVLDVGCGSGSNAAWFASQGKVVDGITFSQEEAILAASACRNVYVHNLEQGLPPHIEGAYHLAFCSHVLEHIAWPSRLLNDLYAALKPGGGRLLVAVPNALYWRHRVEFLRGNFNYTEQGMMDIGHVRWYTRASLEALLNSHGFEVESRYSEGHAPIWRVRSLVPTRLAGFLDERATTALPGVFAHQFVALARTR